MSEPQKTTRPLVAIATHWSGRSGYLHVSEEYNYVQFHRGLGSVREVALPAIVGRLVELARRVPILQEAEFLCGPCGGWHTVTKGCLAPAAPQREPVAALPRPAPPRRAAEIDAGPHAAPPWSAEAVVARAAADAPTPVEEDEPPLDPALLEDDPRAVDVAAEDRRSVHLDSGAELVLADPTSLATRSTEELRAELARALEVTAEHLLRLSAIWQELERRGEDLTELRKGLAFYLPLIAAGKVDAMAVARFAGAGTLLRTICALPVGVQRALGCGENVSLCLPSGAVVSRDPLQLSVGQVRQVFGDDGIRTADQQRAQLQQKQVKPERGAPVRIPKAAHKALKERAAREGLSVEDVLVMILRDAGIAG